MQTTLLVLILGITSFLAAVEFRRAADQSKMSPEIITIPMCSDSKNQCNELPKYSTKRVEFDI